MTITRLIRSELRKLTTTAMPWSFAGTLAILASITAFAVVAGTDFDGSKGFVSTAADQQSLVAFAANAFAIAGLFGTIAVAREFGHGTAISTYTSTPNRAKAVFAQAVAVAISGTAIGVLGTALTVAGVAAAIPTTEHPFLMTAGGVAHVIAAAAVAGTAGAALGGGMGALIRNVGGAVTGTVLALFIAPPLVVQFASDAASWTPTALAGVLSGVATDVSLPAAALALAAWALIPAVAGATAIVRRDVA